ncbi:DUF4426 domain-containing protein [Motiliproteus sp.]|uniref:DUF4426 domain-containing protein n=1 Tax=Motiliproteus sp. TaxID=1898955 RepID=UPI003BAB1F10
MRRLLYSLLTAVLLLPSLASAEQFEAVDQYQIHYNALGTTFLLPEVAEQYQIQRSKVRGLVNISVLDSSADHRAVVAQVSGEIRNLVDQRQPLNFRQVREGDAIYYIAEFRFTDDERLFFELQVQPDPNGPVYPLNFEQHFYVD